MENNRQCTLGFSYFGKIGPANFKRLSTYFSGIPSAFYANQGELEKAGLSQKLSAEFCAFRKNFVFEKATDELRQNKISFICLFEDAYPRLLKEIYDPPFILYYQGTIDPWPENCLAVVGSREHSYYGNKIIEKILPVLASPVLADNKIAVISGLALGIDTLAHRSALKNNGLTYAVLGSGLNPENIYPPENRYLAKEIIKSGGAIISEFAPDTPPRRQNFPQRNRIISGLSRATLIIEAKEKSGALITAASALEQNREVLAIPGNIFSDFSRGTNSLISKGAKTILDEQDILDVFNIETKKSTNSQKISSTKNGLFYPENESEKMVYNIIRKASEQSEIITVDEIAETSQLDTAKINSTLSILEIKGIIISDHLGYNLR